MEGFEASMEGLEASIGALEAADGEPEAAIGSPEAAIGGAEGEPERVQESRRWLKKNGVAPRLHSVSQSSSFPEERLSSFAAA